MAQRRMLTETDREEISRGIVEGLEGQVIAAQQPADAIERVAGATAVAGLLALDTLA